MLDVLQGIFEQLSGADLSFVFDSLLPKLNRGALVSLQLIVPSAVLGFMGGVFLGALRVFAPAPVKRLGDIYTALFRGVPLVVQLMLVYFALPRMGIFFSPMGAAITCFVLCSTAYHSEYVRGALLSIRVGQMRAGMALGMSRATMIWSVVIPQALRRALPGCGNEIIYLIKYSSLASLITCIELTGEGKNLAGYTYRYSEIFMIVGAYYLLFTTLASILLGWLERKFYIPGFGHN